MLPRDASRLPDPPPDLAEALSTLQRLSQLGTALDPDAEADTAFTSVSEQELDAQGLAQAQYRSLIEQIPAVTFLASLTGGRNQLYVSPQIESLLGFSQAEWLSDPILWYRQTHPEDRDRVSSLFAMSCATGQPFRDVFRVLTRTGATVWVHAQAQIIRDARGEPLFLQGVGFDVTDQYRAREAREQLIQEQAARAEAGRERDRLRDIFMHLPAAVVLLSGAERIVEFMNPVAVELADAGERALGQPYSLAFPELASQLADLVDAVVASGDARTAGELRVTSARWTDARFFNAFCQPLEDARGRQLLVHVVEVTDQVRARHEVEAALQLRDEFLSIASHELRTPVTALAAQAELVQRRFERTAQLDVHQVQQAFASILRQSGKLTQLLTQLLDISRFEAGKLSIERHPCDLVALVDQVVDRARATTQQHDITVEAPAQLMADVDELRLEQVLTNLVDNAIKYSPDGGTIDVRVRTSEPGWVTLSVRDHGLGIPPERRAQIFQRFYQAHENRQRVGLGLGLYISQQIVQMHGGQITADFPSDGGTEFTVRVSTQNDRP